MNREHELVGRYAAIWNEPSPERRRAMVSTLWTEDALHVFQPPREVLSAAAALNVTAIFQARGHAELEDRVARAYEEFVATGEFSFRAAGEPKRVADAIRFTWEMVFTDGALALPAWSSYCSPPTAGFASTTSSSNRDTQPMPSRLMPDGSSPRMVMLERRYAPYD